MQVRPMRRRCPICNREEGEVKFYGEICEVCARDKIAASVPGAAEITVCKRCGRIKTSAGFVELDRESLAAAIRKYFKGYTVKVSSYNSERASITLFAEMPEGILETRKQISIVRKETICTDCYRKSSGYYEALFQLRGEAQKMRTTIARLEHYMSKRGSYILSIAEAEGGYDIRLPDKKLAASFIETYSLKPTVSYTLYGIRRGKKIFRNTYSIRF
jgi:NMD protein affecting ribosome stability and mRNA decay